MFYGILHMNIVMAGQVIAFPSRAGEDVFKFKGWVAIFRPWVHTKANDFIFIILGLLQRFNGALDTKVPIYAHDQINFYAKNPVISFTISVFLKESRYKIIITDLKYKDKKGLEFIIHDDNFPKYWGGKNKLYNAVDIEIK